MRDKVSSKVRRLCTELASLGFECKVSPKELLTYLEAPTYESEATPLEEVLENRYLLIHELVEVTLLKQRGYVIDRNVVRHAYPYTYEAHLEAMDVELSLALREGDMAWVERRVRDLRSYLEDPLLPSGLAGRVKLLIEKYTSILEG